MPVNPRYEIHPDGMDGASFGYQTAQRSHYSAGGPGLERGMSYRESHDGHAITQVGPNFAGSVSMGHGETQSLSQVLSLDLIPSPEQKYARQMELRRAAVAATGVQSEAYGNVQPKPLEHQTIEELRRIKFSLSENALRGRERSRTLSEAILKLQKYCTIIHTRRRARAEGSLHERPTPMSMERTAGNPVKPSFCPSPSHANVADSAALKQEDKGKGVLPNKRVRTSILDVRLEGRGNAPGFQRTSGMVDHGRDSFKCSGSVTGLVEDKERTIFVGVEGWEKAKMKRRRSGSKFESNISSHTNIPLEAEREHKWMPTHRTSQENRCRLSEGHGYRYGPVHGVVSMHKAESVQQNVMQMPRTLNKMEHDGSASLGEKLDRSMFLDKERLLVKTGMKAKDESPLLSPTALGKAKPVRAPRSSSGVPVNPFVQSSRPSAPDVWDHTTVRQQAPVIQTNRKRPSISRPSSPPVAQWVGQRPQKIARIARRVNLVPPICTMPILDEVISIGEANPPCDSSGMAINGERTNPSISPSMDNMKRVNNSAPNVSQLKLNSERASTNPSGVSDSEVSEGGDVKTKEKWKKHTDADVGFAVISSQKMGLVNISGKKSRLVSKEEGGDGIRRQGRSSRGLVAVRESCFVNRVPKVDPPSNAKQLRSTRPGPQKPEKVNDVLPCSKPGRPPTKKGIADHKALMRPRRPIPSASGDISGESDDDYEDLCAAIQASVNFSAAACSSIFWKEMECYFRYLTPSDLENLRKQVNQLEEMEASLSIVVNNPKSAIVEVTSLGSPRLDASLENTHIMNGSIEIDAFKASGKYPKPNQHLTLWPVRKQIPLSQRLLAALIVDFDGSGEEDVCNLDSSSWDGSSRYTSMEVNKNDESESVLEIERGYDSKMSNGWVKDFPHEKKYMINGHRRWDHEPSFLSFSVNARRRNEGDLQCNGPDGTDEYRSLTLDERIALELQSVGLFPDSLQLQAMDNDEIMEEVEKSHVELKNQMHINKDRLSSLERAVLDVRPAEERERERLAMSKLIEIAFTKRVGGRGTVVGVSGIKSSTSKSARAVALSFAKRTLSRWHQYIETGKSCFCDPTLRKTLFCIFSESGVPLSNIDVQDDEMGYLNSSKLRAIGLERANLEGCGHRLLLTSPDEKADRESFDSGQVAATLSDGKDEVWSSRPEKRLDDVGGVVLCGAKGKRSERERDSKESGSKATRQAVGGMKVERKIKTKPRQKAAPLFKAVNGLLERPLEDDAQKSSKSKDESLPRVLGGESGEGEVLDLSHLQIPNIDDLGGQGQDLGSWLDFEDPGLPDAAGDLMGLDIPMDDLSDLAMMM